MLRSSSRRQFAMNEFGTVYGEIAEIRIDRLEHRLSPRVPFPHRHAFYQLVFVRRGKGWHAIDFRRYPIRGAELFFMRPGQVHSWHFAAGTTGYVVEFGPETMPEGEIASDSAGLARAIPEFLSLRGRSAVASRERIERLLEWLATDRAGRPKFLALSARHYLFALLTEVARRASPGRASPRPKDDPYLERFQNLVEAHFVEEHEVGFYAGRMRLTPKALTMRISRALGKPARAVIHERVTLEAKRLLAYSNYSVAEVGREIGFEDPSYFTRFFAKAAKETPTEFRERIREG